MLFYLDERLFNKELSGCINGTSKGYTFYVKYSTFLLCNTINRNRKVTFYKGIICHLTYCFRKTIPF